MTKPVVGYIAGVTAPPGKRMGHAGAIIAGGKAPQTKNSRSGSRRGCDGEESPADIGSTLQEVTGCRCLRCQVLADRFLRCLD